MVRGNLLSDLIQSLKRHGEQYLPLGFIAPEMVPETIENLCETLLSSAGEASGVAIASVVLEYWQGLDEDGRAEFLDMLDSRFGVDLAQLDRAAGKYLETRSQLAAAELHRAAEPRRQDLFRRLNLAPGGVAALVGMREELLRLQGTDRTRYAEVDIDFVHLFSSWFNRGFLTLERIDWSTPARILEKVIRYEAVHEIHSWDDLRRRLEPEDRRCYAFFHPQLPEEPLIFVEVALTTGMPSAISPLLAEDRPTVPQAKASHAVFYSISNCQKGLLGVSFGNFLIKQVVEELRRQMPGLTDFVTLSPVPRFAAWLRTPSATLVPETEEARAIASEEGWEENPAARERLSFILPVLAAHYLVLARDPRGRILDPVARFHVGNGASLARINCFGDASPKASKGALGLMVNYRYKLGDVERNHERFVSGGEVMAAPAVMKLLSTRSPNCGSARQRPTRTASIFGGVIMTNHLFDAISEKATAQRPFIITDRGSVITYRDMMEQTAQFAHALALVGVKPGDRVMVQVEKSAEMIMLYLACLRTGSIFLPLNTAYTSSEAAYFITDAEPRIVVVGPAREAALSALAEKVGAGVLTLADNGSGSLMDLVRKQEMSFVNAERGPEDLAALLYTSGTTGRSKGAMLTHDNLLSNARVLAEIWRFKEEDVLIHALPLFHTHGLFVATNVTLAAGSSMILLPKFDPDRIVAALPQASVLMGVPTFYVRLLQHQGVSRDSTRGMRLFVSGSAPLLAETHERWQHLTGHCILERYGMTETNMNTSNPYEGERRAGTVGFPLPGTSILVTDTETGRPLGRGDVGMIEVKGPNVFAGYWRMPDKTRAEFREDGHFITGDLGMIDEDGYVHIVGRGKDLIIAGGYNIYPKELELLIDAVEGVGESAVIGLPHPDLGEGTTAIVVRAPDATVGADDILAELSANLARFKHPRRVIFVDELPRNTMGKVQKNVLRDRYADLYQQPPA